METNRTRTQDIRPYITGRSRVVGVIGAPVQHSRSPQMHNAAFVKAGLDYAYLPFHVHPADIEQAIAGFQAINVVGLNVTVPHKQAVIPFLTSLSREAELIGAVNTLIFSEGTIHGDNTDARGFLHALEEASKSPINSPDESSFIRGEHIVILGAGGSARAVVVALALAGAASIFIANRTAAKAIALADEFHQKTGIPMYGGGLNDGRLPKALHQSSLLVNTATASMDASHPLLISEEWLQPHTFVYDIVYTPPVTPLMHAAVKRGCKTLGGLGMLVHQGAIAFEKWTGIRPCIETMRHALES